MKKILTIAIISMFATGAFAKGHNQSATTIPGMDVGTETVAASHTLGGAKGNRPDDKGPTNSPAVTNAGR